MARAVPLYGTTCACESKLHVYQYESHQYACLDVYQAALADDCRLYYRVSPKKSLLLLKVIPLGI
jgi:hypothetical protein